jgi:formate hydrogenlyase transcriptional activator
MTDPVLAPSPADEVRLQFETLLIDVSARLAEVKPGGIDADVTAALQSVLEFFEADRCALVAVDPDGGTAHVTHAAYAPGVDTVSPELNLASLYPWLFRRLLDPVTRRSATIVVRLADLPSDAQEDRVSFVDMGVKSHLTVPVQVGDRVRDLIVIQWTRAERPGSGQLVPRLRLLGQILVTALERSRADLQLKEAEDRLAAQLRSENLYLQQQVKGHQLLGDVAGHSLPIQRVLEQARQVAPMASTVLLVGETGTGKERFASVIHDLSPRRQQPMIRVNCAAIPTTLIESELFGREKGAYTGALSRQAGRFELASGSTLFLDEIGDLPPEVQVKLLRVLQEKRVERLGSPRSIPVDVRLIVATHQELEKAVREGRFREDLYYRLNVFPILIPPLRERREDIPALVATLVDELGTTLGKRIESIAKTSMDALVAYDWPGNVRELRNILERAMILAAGPVLHVEIAGTGSLAAPHRSRKLQDVEREHILAVLRQTGWRIRGKRGAAEVLGLKPTTLEYRMAKLGIGRRAAHTG